MMQASMIVSDWQPEIGRSPTPEQLRDIFQKELLDFGPALFLADKGGVIRWCNSGYRRVAEVQTEDGRIGDLLPLRQVAEEIEYSRSTVYREDRYIIGQTTQVLKSRMVPVFDSDGHLSGFGGILQMFADHGIGVEDIALMLDRYMDFLRLTADWVWEADGNLNFTMVSQRISNALDRPPQEYIGKNLLTMMVTDTLRQAAKRRFERMTPFRDVPFDAVDGEGKRRLFMLSAVPVFDRANGTLKGYRGAATDITELTKREESLRMAKEQADVASRAKTHFLANMSHELRTPLNAIIGFADVMRMEMIGPVSNPQYKSYIRDIHGSALHLLGIINDILDVSRIEAGKVTLHESVVSLDEVVESVVRLVKERVTDSQLALDLDIAAKLPRIHADKQKLKQILINLIGNAIKFTPKHGRITVGARLSPHGELELSVTDNGIGISQDNIDRVLEPFVQVDSALHRKFDGAGLGLPLSRGLARLHGGDLRLESAPGQGTRAVITLPATRLLDGKHLAAVR
ncbi:MAG TPA: PAS domain-containing sensor histidine kinase [Dongiaceae bacterium]